ncbi:MAG: glycosyltransferase [Acidobacteriota bacterium]|nr:glycosyltransferase [Acidobacteriota bacterium]
MSSPAVSVVMPVWNPDRDFLEQAIRSLLAQTFGEFELIIVEDPSPQRVADIVAPFRDPRIRVISRTTPAPIGAALNEGVAAARAPLIARLDADDIALPHRFEQQVAFLEQHPEVDVYGSRITIINERGEQVGRRLLPLTHDEIANAFRRYNCISHPAVMFRRAAFDAVGGYDRTRRAEDYDLWCRMLLNGARFENCADDLIEYRVHEQATKYRVVREAIRVTIDIKEQYFRGRFTLRERARLLAEHALLHLPPRLVVRLFLWLEYRR